MMNKKTICLVCSYALVSGAFADTSVASNDNSVSNNKAFAMSDKPFPGGLGLKVSTLGVGLEYEYPINDKWGVSLGYNRFSYDLCNLKKLDCKKRVDDEEQEARDEFDDSKIDKNLGEINDRMKKFNSDEFTITGLKEFEFKGEDFKLKDTDININPSLDVTLSNLSLIGKYYPFDDSGFHLAGGITVNTTDLIKAKVSGDVRYDLPEISKNVRIEKDLSFNIPQNVVSRQVTVKGIPQPITISPNLSSEKVKLGSLGANVNATLTAQEKFVAAEYEGTFTAKFSNTIAPYLGIGYKYGDRTKEGFSFNFDIGAIYVGGIKTSAKINRCKPIFRGQDLRVIASQLRQNKNNDAILKFTNDDFKLSYKKAAFNEEINNIKGNIPSAVDKLSNDVVKGLKTSLTNELKKQGLENTVNVDTVLSENNISAANIASDITGSDDYKKIDTNIDTITTDIDAEVEKQRNDILKQINKETTKDDVKQEIIDNADKCRADAQKELDDANDEVKKELEKNKSYTRFLPVISAGFIYSF